MTTARLCLKARPTARQLADRLQPLDGRLPDGLELYLDVADIADQATIDDVVRRIEAAARDLPADFAWLIEGPVPSLDGAFFDVTRDSPEDRLVVERLAALAGRIGCRAVNIHLISAAPDLGRLTLAERDALLRRAVPFLRHFVDVTRAAGAVPTIENMPPVMRMRVGGWYFTPIGMASADLLWAVEEVPGLEIMPDTSHAGLYLAARRLSETSPAEWPAATEGVWPDPAANWLMPLMAYLRALPPDPADLVAYLACFAGRTANAQVSNAAGLLGEGVPYAEGDYDLDPAIRWLGGNAAHLVTETLEPDPDDARTMRDALRRMRAALA